MTREAISPQPSILCISSYEKGQPFLREAAHLGLHPVLLTVDPLRDASWPHDALTGFFTMPDDLAPAQILNAISFYARTHTITRIVALDEFDLEVAALAREHMRLPGIDISQTSLFRDKLSMRVRARDRGIPVPSFTSVFHYDDLRGFLHDVPGPWLLKPRANASAIGIHKLTHTEEIWLLLDDLGDLQTNYLLEQFVPGDIFHVEGITFQGQVLFAAPFGYGQPPMQTMHEGGVFTTRSLDPASPATVQLLAAHQAVLHALGMTNGVTHTEFIRSHATGEFLFLETAARVGGAYIADVVGFAHGLNPWVEWARIEAALIFNQTYHLPPLRGEHAGSVICLARQQHPDTTRFNDPEVVFRLDKHPHAGVVVQSPDPARVQHLVETYSTRFLQDFCAVLPAPTKPTA